ncbi:protein phosphatase 2C domain-containing protein [Lentibacillus sp. CBA3610]|uniref:protein phosphatase 2C domain-containing protein n=1 Tax=Lentibacillus sp. CBA3610 TaxID=2518176 RepID=UPI00159522CD|nr:protein phosphatase 2C domain-containing protein [Lentibacillus sp. CBA3610]QKY71218.1 indirect negative regulator of sigma-B activity [Lentibacillus sp. CBA3610]
MNNQRNKVETAVFQKAKQNQHLCGDSYFYTETEDEYICALADGLGSGEFAKESSDIVIRIIEKNIHATVEQLIKKCNGQLSGKRGAVIGILRIDFRESRYTFSSIGNVGILTIFENGVKKRNIPNAGYLAGYHRPFKVVTDTLYPSMSFILFSDGVTDKDLSQRFLLNRDVNQVVQTYANYTNGEMREDDTTLIAIKYGD